MKRSRAMDRFGTFGSDGVETELPILLSTEISGISGIMESSPSNPLEIKVRIVLYSIDVRKP